MAKASGLPRFSFNGWTAGLEIVGDGEGIIMVEDLGRLSYRRGEKQTPAEGGSWPALGSSAYTWEPHHTLPAWRRSGYGNQLHHFARCILDGTPPFPSLWDGWRNLVVARAIVESCATRRTVEVPQED